MTVYFEYMMEYQTSFGQKYATKCRVTLSGSVLLIAGLHRVDS